MDKKTSRTTAPFLQSVLKGVAGAVLGALAAKLAGDIYDQVKKRYVARSDRPHG